MKTGLSSRSQTFRNFCPISVIFLAAAIAQQEAENCHETPNHLTGNVLPPLSKKNKKLFKVTSQTQVISTTSKASVDEAKECNITASKSKERGIERHAAIAACAAPINDEKESHPKFNIMFDTHMKIVAFPLGKTGHNDPVSYVIARRTTKATRLINPSNAKSIVSGHCSLRHFDVMIAMREYCVVATKHSMQPAIVFPAALEQSRSKEQREKHFFVCQNAKIWRTESFSRLQHWIAWPKQLHPTWCNHPGPLQVQELSQKWWLPEPSL